MTGGGGRLAAVTLVPLTSLLLIKKTVDISMLQDHYEETLMNSTTQAIIVIFIIYNCSYKDKLKKDIQFVP